MNFNSLNLVNKTNFVQKHKIKWGNQFFSNLSQTEKHYTFL